MDLQFSHSASISNLPSLTPSQIHHWPFLFCLIFFLLSKHVIFARVKGTFNLNTASVPSCLIQLKMFLSILRHLSVLLERLTNFSFSLGRLTAEACNTVDTGVVSHQVMSSSLWLHGLQPAKFLCLWDFPGINIGMDCHFLLQGIFLTQGLNLGLLFRKQILYHYATWEALQTNCKKHLRVSSKKCILFTGPQWKLDPSIKQSMSCESMSTLRFPWPPYLKKHPAPAPVVHHNCHSQSPHFMEIFFIEFTTTWRGIVY